MIEMPPLQFAQTNGIRMGFYEAGPNTDRPPLVLCHGWPELAFSWRHQIKALSEAGLRVVAPDQRGYGATDRPEERLFISLKIRENRLLLRDGRQGKLHLGQFACLNPLCS